ncbi:uncharacterized protein LOC113306931 [Papaver somniferum]|uniref:uncharacterized protein LOC113306931 n=1 Tax=Papaver somniferum TaxID=3469 RepID=UPI000E6F82A7|nr:uncharacterized protein LOC113306931 [Papaver somniferum]
MEGATNALSNGGLILSATMEELKAFSSLFVLMLDIFGDKPTSIRLILSILSMSYLSFSSDGGFCMIHRCATASQMVYSTAAIYLFLSWSCYNHGNPSLCYKILQETLIFRSK